MNLKGKWLMSMKANKILRMAKEWKTVPKQISCDSSNALDEPILIGAREETPIKLDASSCDSIKFLEHVHLHINLKTQVRGQILCSQPKRIN